MIQTHASMLIQQSTDMCEESVHNLAQRSMQGLENLREAGWSKVASLEKKLNGLREIRRGIADLSQNSRHLLELAGNSPSLAKRPVSWYSSFATFGLEPTALYPHGTGCETLSFEYSLIEYSHGILSWSTFIQ